MGSPTHKNYGIQSTSTKSLRSAVSTSEESVFETKNDRKYSTPLFESVRKLSLNRNPASDNPNRRRVSVPFPVTEVVSKWRRTAKSETNELSGYKNLKVSRSQESLQQYQRRGSQPWRVLQLVHSAKRKFTGEDKLPPVNRKLSFTDLLKLVQLSRTDSQKRRMVRLLKQRALQNKKNLLAKFRMAVKLTIFCARNFKEHCLRINAEQDELAPFIRQLHFHEDNAPDLLIDLTQFKANRQLRIPEETKRILSKEVGERTEQEINSVTIALRNIKCIGDYPKRMQRKIAEVGLYEKYEAKRIIVRQGHPASGFYFILSGAVVVMVMDMENRFARPVAHLYKGQTFGELAIVNRTPRNSTVIAKETCEFLSISVQDYHKIFMDGGVKTVNDPDQEIFLNKKFQHICTLPGIIVLQDLSLGSLRYLSEWPIHLLKDHPTKCKFLFFKRNEVIIANSHQLDWVIIVKSGSVQIIKKLRKVDAFEWRKKSKTEPLNNDEKRELAMQRSEWRRILPELSIPLRETEAADQENLMRNGRPEPFQHPDDIPPHQSQQPKKPQIPNLWPFNVDLSEVEYGRYVEDDFHHSMISPVSHGVASKGKENHQKGKPRLTRLNIPKNKNRRTSMLEEEEKELLGFQPHIRTIMEDIEIGVQEKSESNPEDENPEFVHVQTLTKGQAFGFADMFIGDQPSFSVISKGADCLLINKQFYQEHASEKLIREVRQNLCPFPSDEDLQKGLQLSVDWDAYRKSVLSTSIENLSLRRIMRNDLRGTKVKEAFT